MQPNYTACKTNPPGASPASPQPAAPKPLSPIARFVLETALMEACDAMQPHATPCNATQPNQPNEKTNPPRKISDLRHERQPPEPTGSTLTPRQLAAARLIAAGHTLPDVAVELRLNRSTVWRWTRDPAFRAELDRLHRQWSTPARTTGLARSRPS
jgi:Homeodomain-like domain